MAGLWDEFREGAAAGGVPEPVAERVFTQVIAFSEFGFPKSHAAAFGLLAYQSAWLRHYHPAEYYCALFNNQPMGFYSLDALGRDANRSEERRVGKECRSRRSPDNEKKKNNPDRKKPTRHVLEMTWYTAL